ncbi:MAG: type II toxin-antitoxin system VapC family toxin [Acidimicrobiia bacterium]|nr:type II toxin-antitoxin system VapC family toxin [Acidimicrobiia bacterium]
MVIDTSALVAVVFDEPERAAFADAIAADPRRLVSATNMLESMIVVEARRGAAAARELDLLIHHAAIATVAVTEPQVALARGAWRQFGKGRHPAALNLGDCFAYALARHSGEPLLFKGADFALTDVAVVPVG